MWRKWLAIPNSSSDTSRRTMPVKLIVAQVFASSLCCFGAGFCGRCDPTAWTAAASQMRVRALQKWPVFAAYNGNLGVHRDIMHGGISELVAVNLAGLSDEQSPGVLPA